MRRWRFWRRVIPAAGPAGPASPAAATPVIETVGVVSSGRIRRISPLLGIENSSTTPATPTPSNEESPVKTCPPVAAASAAYAGSPVPQRLAYRKKYTRTRLLRQAVIRDDKREGFASLALASVKTNNAPDDENRDRVACTPENISSGQSPPPEKLSVSRNSATSANEVEICTEAVKLSWSLDKMNCDGCCKAVCIACFSGWRSASMYPRMLPVVSMAKPSCCWWGGASASSRPSARRRIGSCSMSISWSDCTWWREENVALVATNNKASVAERCMFIRTMISERE